MTLIELLMAVVISAIAMFALVPPFLAEGNLFRKGKRQTEAQRDAQMALRAIARVARESNALTIHQDGSSGTGEIEFARSTGSPVCFRGGPSFNGGRLERTDNCDNPINSAILVDGNRSRVVSLTFTRPISGSDKLVRVNLQVTHRLRTSDPLTEQEVLETELFLRNGT